MGDGCGNMQNKETGKYKYCIVSLHVQSCFNAHEYKVHTMHNNVHTQHNNMRTIKENQWADREECIFCCYCDKPQRKQLKEGRINIASQFEDMVYHGERHGGRNLKKQLVTIYLGVENRERSRVLLSSFSPFQAV